MPENDEVKVLEEEAKQIEKSNQSDFENYIAEYEAEELQQELDDVEVMEFDF